jgi:hypothetical protein
MQIDIRLIPFYEKPFKKLFPRMASLLREHGYTRPLERDTSLYDLVDVLADMARGPSIPGEVRARLRPHVERLDAIRETAREQLLARELNELDQSLYALEDAYDELERSL